MRPEGRRYIQYGGLDSSVEEYMFPFFLNWFHRTEAANDDTRIFFSVLVGFLPGIFL